MSKLIIIHAELVMPPSWTPSVRDLTLYLHCFCGKPRPDIVIDCGGAENVDLIHRWLKPRGCCDFIDDLIGDTVLLDGIHVRAHPPRFKVLTPETFPYIANSLRDCLLAGRTQ